ncbi:MAG: right-handed parallel beta-helix repeat-containing protein [Acidobacteriota bacterium]
MTRTTRTKPLLPILTFTLVQAVQPGARAGSLDPTGPPAPTMKTLVEVEPRIAIPGGAGTVAITASGSYYLTGNRTGVAGSHGITISTGGSSCTLDLNGFSLMGVPGSATGIYIQDGYRVVIRNGSVYGFGQNGVDTGNAVGVLLESVDAVSNGGMGFKGVAIRAAGCTARGNTLQGFYLYGGSVLDRCSAISNGSNGFDLAGDIARDCTATGNQFAGFDAFGGAVERCMAIGNVTVGIDASLGTLVIDNECASSATGILISGDETLVKGNVVRHNTTGISGSAAGLVVGNMATQNTTNYSLSGSMRAGAIDILTTQGEIQTNGIANFSY